MPNEPEILVELNTGLLSNVVVLVLNDPLSIFKFDILVENEADGATNDPDIIVELNTGFASNVVVLELNDADELVNDPDIIADVNTGLLSNEVTLVDNEELGATNDPEIFAAVKLLINTALDPNEPEIPDDVNTPFPSNDVTLVENDPLSVFKLVILELKLELASVNELEILVAVKLLINVALGPREPEMSDAVNTSFPSNEVTLLENEDDGATNDPLIFEAI